MSGGPAGLESGAGIVGGTADRWWSPARLVMAVFFLHALLIANWLPRIPDVQEALGLSHGALAIAMMGLPLGMFLGIAVSGPTIKRLSPRRTILLLLPAACLALALPGLAWNGATLFAGLFIFGVCLALVDVGMNVEAARIEAAMGRRIMSTCHGFWSVGSMIGALIAGGLAEAGLTTGQHLAAIGLASMPVGFVVVRALPSFRPTAAERGDTRRAFALPSLSILGLCFFVLGVVIVEQVARNWGGVFLKDILGASPGAIGLALGGFAMFMAIGRFLGDPLSDRFGAVAVARGCGVMAITGILLTVTATELVQALAGFVAMGVGASVGFPLAISAVAARNDRAPATNVAAVAFFAYASSLIGPMMVGIVSEEVGLRIGFAMILPLVVASAILAGQLRRQRPEAAAGPLSQTG